MNDKTGVYSIGAGLVGLAIFVMSWLYCVTAYGFLIGVTLGWIPSLIAAFIGGILWPVVVVVLYLMFR